MPLHHHHYLETDIDRHLPPRTMVPSHLRPHQIILQTGSCSINLLLEQGSIPRFMIPVFRSILHLSDHLS